MRYIQTLVLASLCAFPLEAHQSTPAQQVVMECRDLSTSGNYLGPNETLINGQACRPAGTPVQVIESNPQSPPQLPAGAAPSAAVPTPPQPPTASASVSPQPQAEMPRAALSDAHVAETVAPASAPTAPAAPAAPAATITPSASEPSRKVPEKVVGFAIADGNGVHSGMPGWAQNWIRKNAKKYREISFQQGRPVQGAQNYLIVLSSSANAVSGFDPVVRTDTSTDTTPVSGSGTVTDNYGSTWDYTYDGQVTTTTTTTTQENVPYTVESNTLYATAYDESGAMISQHWHVYSTKQGGDAANSLGYNLGNLLFAINARGHLLSEVVKDIEGKRKR